jgi:uncharacterized protein DUF402
VIRFEPGQTVVRREVMRGELWFAYASICVQDDGDLLVTYLPPGTPFAYPTEGEFPAGRHPWETAGHRSWGGHGMLALHWADIDHAIFLFWKGPEREFTGWYFNLQDAPRRTPIGFDTVDHELDIVWPAGAPAYEWKDVEEFARTGDVRYPGRVAEIQAEGDRIAALLDGEKRWWDEGWADWQPDPAWAARQLPEGWAQVPFETR